MAPLDPAEVLWSVQEAAQDFITLLVSAIFYAVVCQYGAGQGQEEGQDCPLD